MSDSALRAPHPPPPAVPADALPRLLATDLDGTVVRSDDTVSGFTSETLARLRASGVTVVGATGRGPRLLEMTREHLPAADVLVMAGGGRVVDLRDAGAPRVLSDQRMDGPLVAALLDELEAAVGPLLVMVEVLDTPDAPLWGDLDPSWPWPERVEPVPRAESLNGEVIKTIARSEYYSSDALMHLAQRIISPSKATVTSAGFGFIELCPPGVDKAIGLATAAAAVGVEPAEALVFGDMPNDVPMFEWAGWRRVAVANAHPEVRAVADDVTLTNDEDGVAVWLRRQWHGLWRD